jgi:hypothetical protein
MTDADATKRRFCASIDLNIALARRSIILGDARDSRLQHEYIVALLRITILQGVDAHILA